MSKSLPDRPNLEHLKNEAKALKKSQAIAQLSEAQFLVAKEYGFASWSKLKQYVEGFDSRRSEFFAAIRAGDKDRVTRALLLAPGLVRAHDPDSFGQVPIAAAANRNDIGMIDLLLKHGADVDARSDWWAGSFGALDFSDEATSTHLIKKGATLTPHAAARLGLVPELQAMVSTNAEIVHQRGGDGQFPLHFAKTPEIVDILVAAGADLDACDFDHEASAAQWRIKDEAVLRRLVEHGATTDIFISIALNDPEMIRKHLSRDPQSLNRRTTEVGTPAIHANAPGGHIYLYELGPLRPLQVALNLEKEAAFRYLFEISSPPAKLLAAAWKADRELAAPYQSTVHTLLPEDAAQICDAARYRKLDSVQLMLELGFDINSQDHELMSPIMWAGFQGWLEGVEALLPYHPDLELKNIYGGTTLGTTLYGSMNGWDRNAPYAECVHMLIRQGAKILPNMRGTAELNEILNRYST